MGAFHSLSRSDEVPDEVPDEMPDKERLEITIVGAGLSGIAAAISCASFGHRVKVIEQAKELAEVSHSPPSPSPHEPSILTQKQIGAGLQITPNASRLLQHWHLPASIWQAAAEPTTVTVHRYTGSILAHEANFNETIRRKYPAPFVDLHRVDLQRALYARAQELGVTFHLNEKVSSIDFASTTVHTACGNTYAGDLIIAADGLWSRCRECFLGVRDDPLPTGDLAYRIVLNIEQIEDAELRALVENPQVHFWIGDGAHAVAYSLRGGRMFNLVLLVPDNLPAGVARATGSVEEMRELFKEWDPM